MVHRFHRCVKIELSKGVQVNDMDNRNYYKSFRIQIFAGVTVIYSITILYQQWYTVKGQERDS